MSEPKKKYHKPKSRRIPLRHGDRVLAACKTRGGLRSWGHKCDNLQGHCVNRRQGS